MKEQLLSLLRAIETKAKEGVLTHPIYIGPSFMSTTAETFPKIEFKPDVQGVTYWEGDTSTVMSFEDGVDKWIQAHFPDTPGSKMPPGA